MTPLLPISSLVFSSRSQTSQSTHSFISYSRRYEVTNFAQHTLRRAGCGAGPGGVTGAGDGPGFLLVYLTHSELYEVANFAQHSSQSGVTAFLQFLAVKAIGIVRSYKLRTAHSSHSGVTDFAERGKIKEDQKWDGLKGYLTNTNLSPNQVYEQYNGLWVIEKAFRVAKGTLDIRPVFHFTPKRIEAHVCICFVAFKVYKELERILKISKINLSVEKVIDIVRSYKLRTAHSSQSGVANKKPQHCCRGHSFLYSISYS